MLRSGKTSAGDDDNCSRAHEGKKERGEMKGECGGICGEEEGNADYGEMVQPSQQHVAPCVHQNWSKTKFIVATFGRKISVPS